MQVLQHDQHRDARVHAHQQVRQVLHQQAAPGVVDTLAVVFLLVR